MSQETLDHFLRRANRIPLLTPAEELILARKVQAMQALQAEKPDGPYNKTEKAVMVRGKRAKDRFVTANLRLVASIALKYQRAIVSANAMDAADLLQEGMFGLTRAVELFDPERGYKFSTYAYWWIRQSIARGVHLQSRTIRLPIHVAEKLHSIANKRREFQQLMGRAPSTKELAEAIGWDPDVLQHALSMSATQASLDVAINDDGTGALMDTISDADWGADEQLEAVEQRARSEHLQEMLSLLTDREREAIAMRYGLLGDVATLQQIAERFGVSRERARQVVDRGMKRLKYLMSESKPKVVEEPPAYAPWTLKGESVAA
jgi:RNA polymerase primary sigma factor